MKNISLIAILAIQTLLLSCNSKKEEDAQLKLLQKVDSLINENKKLNEKLAPTSDSPLTSKKESKSTENLKTETNKGKYAFVVLTSNITEPYFDKLLEKMTTKTERYFVCSKVKSFDVINDDIKYQFMDEFQSGYMTGRIQGGSYSTKISDRKCFAFNTYEEASKERETYLVNKD